MWPWNNQNIYAKLIAIENKIDANSLLTKQIAKNVELIIFRLSLPEEFGVKLLSQEEKTVMGTIVQVFTYELNIVAAKPGVDKQTLTCENIFQDVNNPETVYVEEFSPEAKTVQIKAIEGKTVTISLVYADDDNNKSEPRSVTFLVEDKVSPEAPDIDALSITQLPIQEEFELPEVEPVPTE
jgi:hypothetical protein